MFKKLALTLTSSICLAIMLTTPTQAIINGTSAVGSDFVVTMLFGSEKVSSHCTGAYLRPRIVVTAAHCVIRQGGRSPELIRPIEDWYVSQPGIDWLSSSAQLSKVKVLKIWTDPNYFNRWEPERGFRETQVNDIAFLFLERELNGSTLSRAATREEIEDFRSGNGRAFHLGYGCIGENWEQRKANDGKPYLADELVGTNIGSLATPIWDRFLLAQYPLTRGEVCSGDSGSPLLMKKGNEVLYLGSIFAGGNGPTGIKYASTTVLWPFIPDLDKAFREFLLQEAELKAKAEADAKAAAEKAAAELKARQEAEANAAALKNKKSTINCVRGLEVRKVSAVNPKCPKGYKKK